MKKTAFLLVLVSLTVISCKSNYTRIGAKDANYIPYYLKVYKADSLFIVKDYQRSFEILDSLFKRYEPINMEVYKEYETYLIASYFTKQKQKEINEILKNSFIKYGSTISIFEDDTLMLDLLKKSKYRKKDLLAFNKVYNKKLNKELRSLIENIVAADQNCRLKKPIDLEELSKVREENNEKIKFVYEKYGYPSSRKIGYEELNQKSINLSAVLLHCDADFLENYLLEKMKFYLIKGEVLPYNYAGVYDKYLISFYGEKQMYGTFLNSKNELVSLVNESKLDSIRKSVGLNNINYQKWRLKAKYGYEY
ncbi:MAG: hypothetical protein ACOVLC_12060 [Flavobacterium sp.]